MGTLIALSVISLVGVAFLFRFFFALSRESRTSSELHAEGFSGGSLGTYMQIVPIPLDRRRWGPAFIPSLRQAAGPADVEPALLARLMHYYGEKLSAVERRSSQIREWDEISETQREQMTAAAALALMEVKALMNNNEALSNGAHANL